MASYKQSTVCCPILLFLAACSVLTMFILPVFPQGDPPENKELQELIEKAEQGEVDAQNNLGTMYANGEGVPQDYKEAMKWYRLAAEQGDAFAQYALGDMYANGQGVSQDEGEAVKWYRMAAEQGDAFAQCALGVMYADGRGVSQDEGEAMKWFRMAAEQGDAFAQYALGDMYADGRGVSQDEGEAVKWYRAAAEQGDVLAQNNLGWLHATAKDPKFRDPKKAIEYAKKAVEGSQGKEPGYLDTLAEAYYSNREYDKAILTIRKAISLEPDNEYYKEQLKKFENAQQGKGRR